jgi:choline dehydrogenase-like flavoprotein
MHLLRVVRLGLHDGREGYSIGNVSRQGGAVRCACGERCLVHRVNYDAAKRRVTGVSYLDSERRDHEVHALLVILSAHALETPRLLLLSANSTFPHGLANSSGMVGRNLMSHPTWQVFGTFDTPVNAFKGMQMGHVMVQDFYRPDPRNDFARGFICSRT